jgi:hypothetical protein
MFYWLFCDLLILLVPMFAPKLNAMWARRLRVWPFDVHAQLVQIRGQPTPKNHAIPSTILHQLLEEWV